MPKSALSQTRKLARELIGLSPEDRAEVLGYVKDFGPAPEKKTRGKRKAATKGAAKTTTTAASRARAAAADDDEDDD